MINDFDLTDVMIHYEEESKNKYMFVIVFR